MDIGVVVDFGIVLKQNSGKKAVKIGLLFKNLEIVLLFRNPWEAIWRICFKKFQYENSLL